MNRPPLVTTRSPGFSPSSTSISPSSLRPVRMARAQQAVAGDHPHVGGGALVNHGGLRHCGRLRVIAGEDAEICEHLRFESAVAVVDFGAHRQSMRHGVDQGRDIGDSRLEIRFG